MKIKTVFLTAGAILALGAQFNQAQADHECPQTETEPRAKLLEMISIAEGEQLPGLVGFVDQNWSTMENHVGGKDYAMIELGLMVAKHKGYEIYEICSVSETRAEGYYRNTMTAAIDRVRVDLEEEGNIRNITFRPANKFDIYPEEGLKEAAKVKALEDYISALTDQDIFSGTVLLAKDGEILLHKAYGETAELDGVYNLASLNKIYTATAIMQLVEAGDLRLDQTLSELIPELVESETAGEIQIQHLLSHTSGAMGGLGDPIFPPGSAYAYSNYGFYVLGEVIKAVTGMDYDDYLRLNILWPTGMTRTATFETKGAAPGLVPGYEALVEDGVYRILANPYLQIYPGSSMGGYYANAMDVFLFAENLRTGKLVSMESVQVMRKPKAQFGAIDYGFGTILWKGRGIWGHAGDLPGADTDLEIYGDSGYVAVVLGNRDTNNPPVLAKIRSLFFPEGLQPFPE